MDRLRNLDPRRRAADQKMHQTTSTITVNNSPGVVGSTSNGNHEQQPPTEPRQKVSSLVFKFGGDRTKKVPTYTFSPAEQATIEQHQNNQLHRAPSSPLPQPQISPQLRHYIEQLETKNSELNQKLNEQYQHIEHSEKTIHDLTQFCNALQNQSNQNTNNPLLQLVLNFCEVTPDQQQDIVSLFESKMIQCRKSEQQVKSLMMTLKSKEQRITELINEVNELAVKTTSIPTPSSAPRSNSSVSTTPIRRVDSADELDSINLRRELFRTRNRLKEAQREISSQNSLTKHLSVNNLLSSDALITDLRKDISEMGWEVKNLQKTKETLKHDVEKLEKEILTLESQKSSVEEANALITRENKELRATIEELNDQNRIVLQNYQNHVKNYAIHEGLMTKLYDTMAQLEKENSQLKEKCVYLEEKLELKQISLVDKNELEKLNSTNRVLTLQYDYELAKREHCERQLSRLQDNIKQLQSELSYMDEKVKRADEQMKLADRLNRDNKDECEILQLRIMDLEKRLNLTEKDKDIVEQELLIVKQKMEATTYRIQRYNEALINADNDLELSDTSYSEDVVSINGTETVSLKSRNSQATRSQSEV
ncbi:unnamed protein product [Rotaria magnacalcarata]|uniref:Uncharacterized protein n=1 Tax=Rotaria magnacalcarata TaxID=392030 RepID=A0A816LJF9_9BILA|nr:unnamed protein product [Rotaria magnacalcarata]CAF3783590.1 unnamed protein product [Rotaria magnacalcarata]